MLKLSLCTITALVCSAPLSLADVGDYSVKKAQSAPPAELEDSIEQLLPAESLQVKDKGGKVVAEIWLRKHIPVTATADEAKSGLTYRSIDPTTIIGAVRFPDGWKDYRKQPVPAGVYTLRFALQPQDGDHMGTAPYPDFCVLVVAKFDPKAGPLDVEEMTQRSAAGIERSHPAVMLLFPAKDVAADPKLEARQPRDHVVLTTRDGVEVNDQPANATIGLGLTIFGHGSE